MWTQELISGSGITFFTTSFTFLSLSIRFQNWNQCLIPNPISDVKVCSKLISFNEITKLNANTFPPDIKPPGFFILTQYNAMRNPADNWKDFFCSNC